MARRQKTKTLREIWSDAEDQIGVYRDPDLTTFENAINPILIALGEGSTEHEKITSITTGKDLSGKEVFRISTEYTVRSCRQTEDYTIPASIIDSAAPRLAAEVYALEKKLRAATGQRQHAERMAERHAADERDLQSKVDAARARHDAELIRLNVK